MIAAKARADRERDTASAEFARETARQAAAEATAAAKERFAAETAAAASAAEAETAARREHLAAETAAALELAEVETTSKRLGPMDSARHVITRSLNPPFLRSMESYDLVSTDG